MASMAIELDRTFEFPGSRHKPLTPRIARQMRCRPRRARGSFGSTHAELKKHSENPRREGSRQHGLALAHEAEIAEEIMTISTKQFRRHLKLARRAARIAREHVLRHGGDGFDPLELECKLRQHALAELPGLRIPEIRDRMIEQLEQEEEIGSHAVAVALEENEETVLTHLAA